MSDEEQTEQLSMLGLVTIDANGERHEATDEQIDAMLHRNYRNENPDVLADKYMMRHGMYELFKTLTAKVVLDRPADPVNYMIRDFEQRMSGQPKV